jgi:tetratricopeptide (TPR) repeat protein
MSGDHATGDALGRLDRGVFVGRSYELDALSASLEDTESGRGSVVLIAGEPGIGKSSLVSQIESFAAARGFYHMGHQCGVGLPAFWPWTRLLTCWKEERRRARLVNADAVLAMLSQPHDPETESGTSPVVHTAMKDDRFERFDRVLGFFRRVARQKPILLVLEDLHVADPDSINLLHYCAQQLSTARVLILATYRQHELSVGIAPLIVEIEQRRRGRHLMLRGLSEVEVRELIERIAGHTCAPSFASELFTLTEGNPLYIKELLHHLLHERIFRYDGMRWTSRISPRNMPLPPSLEEVVWQRFVRLSEDGRHVLSVASVIGRELDVDTLRRLAGMSEGRVDAALVEARAAHLIDTDRTGRHRFHHPLFREVLHSRLEPVHRARLHLRFGEMIERRYGRDAGRHAATLAYHFSETTSVEGCDKAVRYALRAADDSTQVMAHDDAVRILEAALRVLERVPQRQQRLCDVLLPLAAALWRSGTFDRAREVSQRAAEVARRCGSAEMLARAALSYAGQLQGFGAVVVDQTTVSLLREALEKILDAHPLRPLLMARLAEELAFTESDELGRSFARQAIDLARAQSDPSLLVATLRTTHWALWTPEAVNDRLELADEIVRLADQTNDPRMRCDGELVHVWSRIELGQRGAAEAALSTCSDLAAQLRQPYYSWLSAVTRTCLAFMTGDLARAESLAGTALALGESTRDPNCLLFYNGQMGHLYWLTGRFAELPRYYSGITEPHPLLAPTVSCARAAMLCDAGQKTQARAEFERWATDNFEHVPRNPTWLFTMCVLTRVCAALGDMERAEHLYRLLTPFEGRNVVIVPFFPYGACAHFLGLLAATMRHWPDAERHFEHALVMNTRMGTTQWVARTQLAYAAMLFTRGKPGDHQYAHALLTDSIQTAQALGMTAVVQRAQVELERLAAAGRSVDRMRESGDATARAQPLANVFKPEGAYWLVGYAGRICRVPPVKGMKHLAVLLKNPNIEIPATYLYAGGNDGRFGATPPPEANLRVVMHEDTADILDGQARRDYVQELANLGEELEEAERMNDLGRIARLRGRIEALEEQLREGLTPTGKPRKFVSRTEENARTAVTKSIKLAIERIGQSIPDLARYLDRSVQRGHVCVYTPEAGVEWDL